MMVNTISPSAGSVRKMKTCENCGSAATVYAMDTIANGWAGRYCDAHIPTGFVVTDTYQGGK